MYLEALGKLQKFGEKIDEIKYTYIIHIYIYKLYIYT